MKKQRHKQKGIRSVFVFVFAKDEMRGLKVC